MKKKTKTKKDTLRTSQVVQWLRLLSPNAKGWGLIPGQGTRSHMLQQKIPHDATKIEDPKDLNVLQEKSMQLYLSL